MEFLIFKGTKADYGQMHIWNLKKAAFNKVVNYKYFYDRYKRLKVSGNP